MHTLIQSYIYTNNCTHNSQLSDFIQNVSRRNHTFRGTEMEPSKVMVEHSGGCNMVPGGGDVESDDTP